MKPISPGKYTVNYTDDDIKTWFITNYIYHRVEKSHPGIIKEAEKKFEELSKPKQKKLAPGN